MTNSVALFEANEGVTRENFNSRLGQMNNGLKEIENGYLAKAGEINSAKGAANGIATLDSSGKVTSAQASAAVITKTASATLTLSEAGRFIRMNSTSALKLTVPNAASVAFPIGTEIEVCRWNTGAVTIAAASGVSLLSPDSAKTIDARYGCAVLKKTDTNTWLLNGLLG